MIIKPPPKAPGLDCGETSVIPVTSVQSDLKIHLLDLNPLSWEEPFLWVKDQEEGEQNEASVGRKREQGVDFSSATGAAANSRLCEVEGPLVSVFTIFSP